MRVLVVNTNRCTQPLAVMPFGACLAAQAAQRAGHETKLLDLMFAADPAAAVAAELAAFKPDVVGLSIRNIDNNDIHTPQPLADGAAALARLVREHSRATLVIGGAAVNVMPEALLEHTGADAAAAGDGEATFPGILDALQAGRPLRGIAGVLWRENGVIGRCGDAPASAPLADCTVPDLPRWLDTRAYLSRMSAVPVQSKRGCPFDCVYCTYNVGEGRQYRLHEPAAVARAIAALARKGFRDFEFVDNVFNSPYEHAMEICRCLAGQRPRVRLQSLEMNPRFLDDALMTAMERAGFVGMGITVESAADPVLAGLGKGFTAADVHRTAEVVARHKVPCLWIFMLGGPSETQETVGQTLRFAKTCIRPGDTAFFQTGIRIYPGTELERIARRQGVLAAGAREMLSPVFYCSPQVDLAWMQRELGAAGRENLNFIIASAIGLPLLQKVLGVSYRLGFRPPLWRHTRRVRRVLKLLGVQT